MTDSDDDDSLRRDLLVAGIPDDVADDYISWHRTSRQAVGAVARGLGQSSRAPKRAVLLALRCERRGHLLANVHRTVHGPVLWPAVGRPDVGPPAERSRSGRDPAPVITGHYMVERGYRPHLDQSQARLLTVPASTSGWVWWQHVLHCRCGQHAVDLLRLSDRFRTAGADHGGRPDTLVVKPL